MGCFIVYGIVFRRWLGAVSQLRPYQQECIDVCLEAFQNGTKRQAISLPVGSGKTVIFSHLIKSLPTHPTARKVLVLAHREELILQAKRQIERVNGELKVEIEKASQKASDSADVIVASVPTLGRNSDRLFERFRKDDFKCIIIDEAHHSVADSYMKIMRHFDVFDPRSHILLWGCSATLSRQDWRALGDLFEKVCFHIDLPTMLEQGWLARVEAYSVFTDTDLSDISMHRDDFSNDDLSLAVDTPIRNRLIAASWKREAFEKHRRRATIVFALNIKHVEGLTSAFNELGVRCEAVAGNTPRLQRMQILADFAKGEVPVLVNCAVLTEGTDLPITDCIVMTRPTCSSNMYTQMVGRGLRKHDGKEYCLVLDIVDKLNSSTRSLVSFPSLLSRIQRSNSEDKPERDHEAREAAETQAEIRIEGLKVTVTPSSAFDVDLDGQPLSWVKIDRESWILAVDDGVYLELVIQYNGPRGVPSTCSLVEHSEKDRKRAILTDASFLKAFNAVDGYIDGLASKRQSLYNLRTKEYWRKTHISQAQLALILKLANGLEGAWPHIGEMFRWSKGDAANFIAKYRFLTKYRRLVPKTWSAFSTKSIGFFGKKTGPLSSPL